MKLFSDRYQWKVGCFFIFVFLIVRAAFNFQLNLEIALSGVPAKDPAPRASLARRKMR